MREVLAAWGEAEVIGSLSGGTAMPSWRYARDGSGWPPAPPAAAQPAWTGKSPSSATSPGTACGSRPWFPRWTGGVTSAVSSCRPGWTAGRRAPRLACR